jgi:hypothetical protein
MNKKQIKMMVRLHTDAWFTERITTFGGCCALSSVFAFQSPFGETRSLREILCGWEGKTLIYR